MAGTPTGVAAWGWGALLAALVVLFWTLRIALGGSAFPGWGDPLVYYYPQYLVTFREIAAGRLPLWNPYQLCGTPWLAAIQAGVFYPPHLLYALLPTHAALAASAVLHLLLLALATAVFAARLGLGGPAAVLAGALCGLRGALVAKLVAPNALEAGAWLAPGALAVLALARGGRARPVAGLAAATAASALAGYPQFTVYCAYAWGALLPVLCWQERTTLRGFFTAAAAALAGVVLGALVAGVQLLPTLALAGEATRSLGALPPEQMFPFGAPGGSALGLARGLLSFEGSGLVLSLGLVGLLLLPLAFSAASQRRLAVGLLLMGLLAFAFALGPTTPLFELYRQLPGLGSFRLPNRLLFVVDFCFALLAALGLHALRGRLDRACGRLPRWAPALCAGVLGLALLELFGASPERPALPYFRDGYVSVYQQPRALYSRVALSGERVLLWHAGRAPALPPKLASVFRLRSVDDYEPMNLRRHAEYLSFLGRGSIAPPGRPFDGRLQLPRDADQARELAARQRLLDLAATRYVLVPEALQRDPAFTAYMHAARLRRTGPAREGVVLFENRRTLPRAFVTYRAVPAPQTGELLAGLAAPDFDPLSASYVEGDPGPLAGEDAPRRGRRAAILRDEATRVEVEAELAAPGLLVLADAYDPAWSASVDGRPVEILPVNHLFRGVALPAGRHVVRFEYGRGRVLRGAAASAVGLLLMVGLAVWPRHRRAGPAALQADAAPR